MSPRTKKILAASAAVVLVAFFLWRHWSHGNAAADEDGDHATAVEGSQDSEANRLRAARKYERGAKVPSCVVEGSVESPDGPVAGATVHLSPQRPDLIAAANPGKTIDSITATTDERGRFSIRVADGPYSAAVSHPDYLATGRDVGLACETRGLRFRLQEGGVLLEGEVKDILGGPVGGALVSVTNMREWSIKQDSVRSALTDAGGKYRLRVLPGSYGVAASHPDYVRTWDSITVAGELTRLDLTMSPGAAIEGVVVDRNSGDPVAGARVTAMAERSGGMAFMGGGVTAVSDDAGRFRLRGLESGVLKLQASTVGLASREPTVVQLAIAEQVSDVTVFVDTAFSVSGRVIEQGDPSQGISEAFVTVFDMTTMNGSYSEVPTAEDGSFVIHGIAPGSYITSAFTDKAVPKWMGERIKIKDQDITDLIIELDRGHTIRGRLTPNIPAQVRVEVDFEKVGMAGAMTASASMMAKPTLNGDGTFSIGPVSAGSYFVVATANDGRVAKTAVEVEGDTDGVLLDFSQAIEVSGRVITDDGKPVAGVNVGAKPKKAGASAYMNFGGLGEDGARTDADGRFAVYLTEPGPYDFKVRDKNGPLWMATGGERKFRGMQVDVPDGGKSGVELKVEVPDERITGRVVDSAGAPVADAFVEAHLEQEKGKFVWVKSPPVVTDQDGRFELEGLREAKYNVRASASNGNAKAVAASVKTDSDITITLEPLASVRGRVTSGGQPIASYTITLEPAGDSDYSFGWGNSKRVNDASGGFLYERIEAGDYTVTVKSESGVGTAKVSVTAGRDATIDIEVEAFGTVRGRLLGPDGKPLADASVVVMAMVDGKPVSTDMETNLDIMNGGGIRTDDDGYFVADQVPAGEVMLWLSAESGLVFKTQLTANKTVTVEAGGEVDVGELEAKEADQNGIPKDEESEQD